MLERKALWQKRLMSFGEQSQERDSKDSLGQTNTFEKRHFGTKVTLSLRQHLRSTVILVPSVFFWIPPPLTDAAHYDFNADPSQADELW
ncbi:uncharacterized protein LOC135055968 isoform X3 [Pseudophryne corroboree]|uniref:uncharacterized protein LOC135055968 isoform X3 n=1 Tax=Pseudophryne corroboree TaxID=495146 RepID=UPI003081AC20